MAYKWVQARVTGEIFSDGRIFAQTSDYRGMETPRPNRDFADFDADAEVFDRLWRRIPGKFETFGFMGGAVSILVRSSALKRLPTHLMTKLETKYDPWGEYTYLAEVRNTGAPVIWNVAEPSGGMAEDFNLAAEQIGEAVEMGVYKEDGWLGFLLPEELQAYQGKLDAEQTFWWDIVRPGFHRKYQAPIRFLPYGNDSLDGRKGIIPVGPIGDFQLLSIIKLELPGSGWLLLDTECRSGKMDLNEPSWVPLNRKIVGITQREGKSPMLYEFAPEGGLDHCGLHIALSGEALEYNISHLSLATLKALKWI